MVKRTGKYVYIVKKVGAKEPIVISPTLEDARLDKVRVLKGMRKVGAKPREKSWIIKKVLTSTVKNKIQYKEMLKYYKMR